jgi:predicted Rossmann fold flavoprotein
MKIAIIGGGAAGFFAALSVKKHYSTADVQILEKTTKILSKVKISGGGRCNVTHACFKASILARFYPRGSKQLKKSFSLFNTNHTVAWFKERGVELKKEEDNRMFPITDSSMTIINCFLDEAHKLGVVIKKETNVSKISEVDRKIQLTIDGFNYNYDKVIVATGGSPKLDGLNWLHDLGHSTVSPLPSLFTFNMPSEEITSLQGLSVKKTIVRIQGTKLVHDGPLLITHWGMSGPAVLKTSAWGARDLAELKYDFKAQINWVGISNEDEVRKLLNRHCYSYDKKKIENSNPFEIPSRLWRYLLLKSELNLTKINGELGNKEKNKLINTLLNDVFVVKGKTTFKEEFVTCGGVSLKEVDMTTMQSKKISNLYFAGEVLDIDGVTGGFNFQAAWTTGYIAGQLKA